MREHPPAVVVHARGWDDIRGRILPTLPTPAIVRAAHSGTAMTDIPRVFALTRDLDEPGQIVGYGLVLPDGSAVSVSWPMTTGASFWTTTSAEETADLRGADLVWMDDRP